MRVTIGIDIACRAAHQASCADESGALIWSGVRFRTEAADLERLWARVPDAAEEVVVVMEPTRNAWVPLAAWFRRRGAGVVMVPSERSADLRAYYAKHTKTDRLDSRVLARLPLLHPEGLHRERGLGPGDALRRAVKLRSSLVHRRIAALHRLDALLEILGPAWIEALHSAMDKTALRFLAAYGDPHDVLRLGRSRLTRFCYRHSRGAWGEAKAAELIAAARATLAIWGADGLDYPSLAEDIALEARLALHLTDEIHEMSERIAVLYRELDPDGIVLSAPGVGPILAAQILGRLGDAGRFASLAGVRSYAGLVPREDSSGIALRSGGPTKAGDACLREALYLAANAARKSDPTLAARYHRLMVTGGKHHNSALCSVAAVLLTHIAACLRSGRPYELRDVDGRTITASEGREICTERYTVPPEVRTARRSLRRPQTMKGRDERVVTGVARRSKTAPVPVTA